MIGVEFLWSTIVAIEAFRTSSDPSAPVGALTASRERLMAEKLAEMQSKYNVSMFETRIYRDFVAVLDSIHDTLK